MYHFHETATYWRQIASFHTCTILLSWTGEVSVGYTIIISAWHLMSENQDEGVTSLWKQFFNILNTTDKTDRWLVPVAYTTLLILITVTT